MAEARRFAITPQLDIEQILLEAQHRWLRPAEICEILRNYRNFSIAPEPPNRPPSGSLFLFDRKVLRYFRKDNHNWRKKKDGKTVREAHEMLKAGSVDVLHCYYAHGEENENFQRRSYWMLEEDYTDIVLVHYRDVKLPNTEFGSVASNLEIENDLSLDGKMTYATPLGQLSLDVYSTDEKGLKKYDSFSRWMSSELGEVDDSHINSSSEAYWSSIDSGNVVGDASISNQEQLDTYLVGPSVSSDQLFSIADFSPNWAFAGQETKVLVSGTFLKNKKDVEKCKWSCMFGEIEVPAEVLADGTLLCHAPPHKIGQVPFYITCSNRVACSEVRKFKYRARNKWHTDATDSYITRVNEMDLHIRLEKILSLGSVEHPKLGSGVMKDEQQLVNEINPLTMEGNDEWINTLNQIGEDDFSRENTQQQLHGKLLKGKLHTWLNCRLAEGGKGPSILDKEGQGVLHLAAALGYDWVINPTVTAGVSVNFRDVCGWTAIHWAASCGREKTVATLIGLGAEPGLLTDPTPKFPLGRTPADLASESGHKGISGFLAESSWTSHLNALTLKDSKSSNFAGFSGATGIEDVVERSAIALDYGDMQAGLSLKDSLSAVQKAAQAAARIHQVYGVQSFHRKKLTEYVDQKCDMSDERALSLITLKPNSSGQHDAPVHAAAIRIQNKFRGWKTRKEFLVIQQRIVKIQAHVRGHQVRKQYKKLVWTVGIVEKAILRGRRKGSGLRGFWPERLPDDDGVQNQPWKEDDYDFLQEDRRQSEAILDNELARVKSMVQYPEARDQYRRLLNVVTGLQESKQLESSEDSLRIHSQFESTMDLTQTSSQQFEGEMEKTQMTYQQSKNSGEQTRERCSVEDSTIYGREDDEKRVIELLLSTDCKDSNVSVIHIFSSAGVGKTTFASLVYNNCRVCEIFETRVWICSTEGLDAMGHAKMIIEALTGISCCLTELVEVQETLKEELVGKRFLLVLDNVCNEDPSFWSSLLAPLSAGAKGSIVIGTSRSNLVSSMALMHSYELKLLSEDNCWSIFQHHAFDRRDHDVKSNRIEIGKQIVSKCGGLPLSVKALGGLLCLANSEKSWSTVLESGLWNTNGTLPALRLSYAHLPVYLKRCFGYCSLFPKGYLFERDHLVHLWLSQGFIEHEEGKQVEDTGNEYIDELLKRSFFQQSPICTIEGKYVMHDLFHDLAQSASVNECFRSESYTFCTTPRSVHHMSLVPRYFDKVLEFEPLRNSKDIRTCLLINRFSLKWDTSVFHIKNSAILDDLFLQCSCLRTLDLGFTNIEALPESIANLKHLCYLGLNKTNIKSLPESICDLCSLQILELQDCSHLDELPKGTKNLATLRHLDVWKESGYILMPPGIGQLTGLQTLSTFHVGRDEQYCGIRELKDMVNLRGTLCIGGLENVINGEEAKEANLRMKAHIQSLTLQWCNSGLDLNIDDSAGAASEVLLNLQANTNLKELIIRNYCGDRFSSWVGDLSFSKLISITLDNCFECDVLPPLGHLPSLKYLAIRMMDVVQSVTHEFLGPVGIISHRFPSLEILKLSEMSELAEWCGVESGDFPHLHSISISRCHKLRRLPSFTSLVELTVHCCTQLPDLPILPCLESLKIEGIQNLKFFPLLPDLPALKVIDIKHCTLLSSVRDLSHLASFERLKVINCPKLHFSPHEKLPSMLQTVEIHRSCPLLKDWCPIGFEEKSDAHQATRKLVRQKELGSEVL